MTTPRRFAAFGASIPDNQETLIDNGLPVSQLARQLSHNGWGRAKLLATSSCVSGFRACRESIGPDSGAPHRKPNTPGAGNTRALAGSHPVRGTLRDR
jgi:hypothetical protein